MLAPDPRRMVVVAAHRVHAGRGTSRDGGFERRMQTAELAYIRSSRAAQTVLAENYVGLPLT
ncbi:MAG: hypothetical protein EPO51_12825 [Phenylobacterium sp.]|uniref:hypothetical protein n=1 Tax=Phenylobacterium sp. TaxID=1871053 RepID=UPI0012008DB4|nr:hypothetical protein [Phenylobacterium sp.]TAJ71991.1 MAG: hypothetical protein EPO51_12825 [Phenylobacterium sp.]